METKKYLPGIPLTRSGRPKVPPLDMDAILDRATARVENALSGLTGLEERLHAVGALDAEANEFVQQHERRMIRMALSLHIHDGARAVNRAIGVNREAFSKRVSRALNGWKEIPPAWNETVSARGHECKVYYYSKAALELPELAPKVVEAKTVIDVLRPIRNELIIQAADEGMTRAQIAEMIRRTPSRVSHIVTGRDSRPRKKPAAKAG